MEKTPKALESVPTSARNQVRAAEGSTRKKNTWGGKRSGAGRPKDPSSIRSQLAEAAANKDPHTYTVYEARCNTFIMRHMPERLASLYALLHLANDKSTRARTTQGKAKTFLSLYAQVALIKMNDEALQLRILEPRIRKFVEQYEHDDDLLGEKARQLRAKGF